MPLDWRRRRCTLWTWSLGMVKLIVYEIQTLQTGWNVSLWRCTVGRQYQSDNVETFHNASAATLSCNKPACSAVGWCNDTIDMSVCVCVPRLKITVAAAGWTHHWSGLTVDSSRHNWTALLPCMRCIINHPTSHIFPQQRKQWSISHLWLILQSGDLASTLFPACGVQGSPCCKCKRKCSIFSTQVGRCFLWYDVSMWNGRDNVTHTHTHTHTVNECCPLSDDAFWRWSAEI